MRRERFNEIEERFSLLIKQGTEKVSSAISYTTSNFFVFYPRGEEAGDGYFNMGIDCVLKDVDLEKADNIALSISVYDKDDLKVNMDICWGHPSGKIEAELYPEHTVISEKVINEIEVEIPKFIDRLVMILREKPNGV